MKVFQRKFRGIIFFNWHRMGTLQLELVSFILIVAAQNKMNFTSKTRSTM